MYIGLLAHQLNVNTLRCITKHITVLFSYGGLPQDVEEGLEMIAQGTLRPQVETGSLDDFPKVLDDLHQGRIKSRIALIPSSYD